MKLEHNLKVHPDLQSEAALCKVRIFFFIFIIFFASSPFTIEVSLEISDIFFQ